MVKNININLGGKTPREVAEDDPELMRLWGEINNAWDEIERLLYVAFDAMLSEEHSFSTQAIFYSQTSHAARRTMVESLSKCELIDRPKTARKLENAIKRIKARSDDRNKLAHGAWAYGVDLATGEHGPQRIALSAQTIPDPKNFYSRQRLTEVRDSMRDTAAALAEAVNPIDEAKRKNAKKLNERYMVRAANPLE